MSYTGSERRAGDRRGQRWRLLAYVLVVFVGFFGFNKLESAANTAKKAAKVAAVSAKAVARESLARDYSQCLRSNESRKGIQEFVQAIVSQDGIITPGEQRALDIAAQKFGPIPCPPNPDSDQK